MVPFRFFGVAFFTERNRKLDMFDPVGGEQGPGFFQVGELLFLGGAQPEKSGHVHHGQRQAKRKSAATQEFGEFDQGPAGNGRPDQIFSVPNELAPIDADGEFVATVFFDHAPQPGGEFMGNGLHLGVVIEIHAALIDAAGQQDDEIAEVLFHRTTPRFSRRRGYPPTPDSVRPPCGSPPARP